MSFLNNRKVEIKTAQSFLVSFGAIFVMAFVVTVNASDEQVKTETWSPNSLSKALSSMPIGDVERGKALNQNMMCASCHGEKGIPPTDNWPALAGQKADYTYKTMLDYKSGLRNEDNRSQLMVTLAEVMNEQDMADIAAYYAGLPSLKVSNFKVEKNPVAEKLVRKGDKSRLITPCASCHGLYAQGGKEASPALVGLSKKAFIRTMQLYKNGKRHNDVNQVMSQFAKKLTDEEIEQLADYYQNP